MRRHETSDEGQSGDAQPLLIAFKSQNQTARVRCDDLDCRSRTILAFNRTNRSGYERERKRPQPSQNLALLQPRHGDGVKRRVVVGCLSLQAAGTRQARAAMSPVTGCHLVAPSLSRISRCENAISDFQWIIEHGRHSQALNVCSPRLLLCM